MDKRGVWYKFKNHRWVQDKGLSLRDKISTELYNLFGKKAEECEAEMNEYENRLWADERCSTVVKKQAPFSLKKHPFFPPAPH